MDLNRLCTNCMQGTLLFGVCPHCHTRESELPPRPAGTLPNRTLLAGRYYLGRVMGKGGFGITYLSWDTAQNFPVIVKELYPDRDVRRKGREVIPVPGSEEYCAKCRVRFREEAQVLYDFRTEPSVVNVYQLFEENRTVYYAMERLTGMDLKTRLERQGRLSWEELGPYIKEVLKTLGLLHSRGLIHRDISPDNIFLTTDGQAKLIDFGSVRCYADQHELTTILKKIYAPPEQYYTNGIQGPWTDIYSLCATCYVALSGRVPLSAPERTQGRKMPSVGELCPELPEYVSRALSRGMSLDFAARQGSAEELRTALFPETQSRPRTCLCVEGAYRGKSFSLRPGTSLLYGRDPQCAVIYPAGTRGVSRRQCSLLCDAKEEVFLRDENSTYGTTLAGRRLDPGMWVKLPRGSVFGFAGEKWYVD